VPGFAHSSNRRVCLFVEQFTVCKDTNAQLRNCLHLQQLRLQLTLRVLLSDVIQFKFIKNVNFILPLERRLLPADFLVMKNVRRGQNGARNERLHFPTASPYRL